MRPILFSLGPLHISSFGFFLTIAFAVAVYICWKLAKSYDLDEEKILDLAILSFFGGIIGARVYFIVTHPGLFDSLEKIFLLNRYPGLSFWGGLAGGLLSLKFLTLRFKLNFWQIADFAAIGFLIGLVIGDLGCFFGGCAYGKVSDLAIATPVVGLLGKRFPVSALEALILFPIFSYLWSQVIRFHFNGKIISLAFIFLGFTKLLTENLRGDTSTIIPFLNLSLGYVFSIMLIISGTIIFYRLSKRKLNNDLRSLQAIFSSEKKRKILLLQLKKNWYNHKIGWQIKLNKYKKSLYLLPKVLKRKLNVKPTPTNYN